MRRIILTFTAIFLSVILFAQKITLNVDAPRVVATGEPFRVEFKTNVRPDNFTPPSFTGFDVLAGPTISEGRSFIIVNGKTETSEEFGYTYVLLASESGNTKIGKATVTKDGKSAESREILLEVVKDNAKNSGTSDTKSTGNTKTQSIASDDILLLMETNRSEVYKGEAIIATVKLATRVELAGIEGAKYPSFNGFWTQELTDAVNAPWTRENISGKIYDTKVLKQYILFPQQTGQLTIEMMSMDVIARIFTQASASRGSLFDSFFGGGAVTQDVRRKINTRRIPITVKELPTPAPASFSGAVGDFQLSAALSSDVLTANSSGNLMVKITGQGNIPLISEPIFSFPTSFETYKVKASDNFQVSSGGVSGEKSFDYPFIVRATGNYVIDPIEFSFFNPKTGTYTTLSSNSLAMGVSADNTSGATGTNTIFTGVTKEELKILGSDIRYIRIAYPHFSDKGHFLISSVLYYLILLLLAGAFIGGTKWYLRNRKLSGDTIRVRSTKARKVALNRLKVAKSYMDSSNETQFYQEMLKALWGYVSDKLNIEVALLSKSNISDALSYKGIDAELIGEYLSLIEEYEFAQYAPGGAKSLNTLYNKTIDVISNLEEKL